MFDIILKYKAEKEGKTYIGIDRFFSSSKTCNVCLNTVIGANGRSSLPLDVRSWPLEHCQTTYNCDINTATAVNISPSTK